MHSNLKTLNTIRLYKSWTIFLRFFIDFSFFWIQIQIWKILAVSTARYRYRAAAVTTVTAVTAAVTNGTKNPASSCTPIACTCSSRDENGRKRSNMKS
jgi:hypothetical protein